MDKKDALDIAQKYAETVRKNFDFQGIFLFGSYARWNHAKDSDIDIAVIFADYDNRLQRQTELFKLTRLVAGQPKKLWVK